MIDADAFAALLCDWCLEVRSGQQVLVNASTRMANCYQQVTNYSCSGTPVDMNVADQVTGTVIG